MLVAFMPQFLSDVTRPGLVRAESSLPGISSGYCSRGEGVRAGSSRKVEQHARIVQALLALRHSTAGTDTLRSMLGQLKQEHKDYLRTAYGHVRPGSGDGAGICVADSITGASGEHASESDGDATGSGDPAV